MEIVLNIKTLWQSPELIQVDAWCLVRGGLLQSLNFLCLFIHFFP